MKVERGISQRDLDRLWESFGGKIIYKRRCGEGRYVAPDGKKSTPYHHDRKDASLKLLTFARRYLHGTVPPSERTRRSNGGSSATGRRQPSHQASGRGQLALVGEPALNPRHHSLATPSPLQSRIVNTLSERREDLP